MDEKLSNGIIGGIVAGIVKDIPNAVFHNLLKLTGLSFWDYSAQIALFRHPRGWGEQFYALAFEVIFCIVIGIIYVYLKDKLKTGHYLIRGAIYGALVWFIIQAVILAFRIHALMNTDFLTSIVNSLCSVFYGILLAFIIHYLEERRKRLESK
jgi:RsiW-degrading membrane proteinase PrsW (M82 family)